MKIGNNLQIGAATPAGSTPDLKNIPFPGAVAPDTLDNMAAQKKNICLSTHAIYEKETGTSTNPLLDKIIENTQNLFPYSHMADDSNIICYKGAVFVGDSETNTLCLGDMSQEKNILSIPLSDGGTLRVNRDNIGQLAKAIDMFSPADTNRIMKAISTDAKARSKEAEIESMKLEPFMEAEETKDAV